jgi:hypothetical protein
MGFDFLFVSDLLPGGNGSIQNSSARVPLGIFQKYHQ